MTGVAASGNPVCQGFAGCARTVPEPGPQTIVDLFLGRVWVVAAEVLPHESNPGIEEVQRDAESLSWTRIHHVFHGYILSYQCFVFPRLGFART